MQENEFEKRVRQKMEGFSLLPNDEVWQNVAARIKEKRRRPLALWIIAALLIGGACTWFYMTGIGERSLSKTSYTKSPAIAPGLNHTPGNIDIEKDYQNVAGATKNDQLIHNKVQSAPSKTTKRIVKAPTQIETTTEVENSISDKMNNKINGSTNKQQKNIINSSPQRKANTHVQEFVIKGELTKEVPMHKYYGSQHRLLNDSMRTALAGTSQPVTATDTLPAQKKVAQYKTPDSKHWTLGFTLYGGISNNIEGLNLVSAKSLSAQLYYSPNLAVIGNTIIADPLQYQSKASIGAGAFIKKPLSKRIDISLGLDYHYFSASSFVGSNVAAVGVIFDSAQQKQASISRYYRAGQATLFVNQYHLLQLPVDFGFRLNKNINRPLVFSLGLSPAALIASKALYLNRGANIYYEDKNQFKSFILFGQSSLMFTPVNTSKYSIGAGPVFQYGINSFSKSQTGTDQHLLFGGIKANIIFK